MVGMSFGLPCGGYSYFGGGIMYKVMKDGVVHHRLTWWENMGQWYVALCFLFVGVLGVLFMPFMAIWSFFDEYWHGEPG